MPRAQIHYYLPSTGVRADFKRLMNDFIDAKTIRYAMFSEIWRKRKFSFLCAGRHSEREAREFLERALVIALEFFLPPYQFQVRVGGLYLLHGIYMTQPVAPKVKIRLTVNQWNETIQLQQEASQQNHLDVVYIFNKLLEEHAFHFCYTPSEMNERTLNYDCEDNEINLADDMKEDRHEINRLFNYESMEQLSYLLDHYRQMKINLAGPKAHTPDKSLDVVKGSMVEDLVKMLQSFKESVTNIYKHGRAQGPLTDKGETSGTGEQSILSKRMALKAKIFAGKEGSPTKETIKEDHDNREWNIMQPSPLRSPRKISNSSSEEEDILEDFVSPSSSRRNKRKKSSKDSPGKKKTTTFTKTVVNNKKSSISEKYSNESSSQVKQEIVSSRTISQKSHESKTQIELEYVDSVDLGSKRGGGLASKLKEIGKAYDSSQRPQVLKGQLTRIGTLRTMKSTNTNKKSPSPSKSLFSGKKSPKKGRGRKRKRESDYSDIDSDDVEDEEFETESVLSKKRKSADRRRLSVNQKVKTKSPTKNGKEKTVRRSSRACVNTADKVENGVDKEIIEETTKEYSKNQKQPAKKSVSIKKSDKTQPEKASNISKKTSNSIEAKSSNICKEKSPSNEVKNTESPIQADTHGALRGSRSMNVVSKSPKLTSEDTKAISGQKGKQKTVVENSAKAKDSTQVNEERCSDEDDSNTDLRPVRLSRFKALNQSMPDEDSSSNSPEKSVSTRNKDIKVVTQPQSRIAANNIRVKREMRSLNEEILSEEENSSPRKKSRPSKEVDNSFKNVFGDKATFPMYTVKSGRNNKIAKTGPEAKESTLSISKTPLSKIISGKVDAVPKDAPQVEKSVKVIRIVTKGSAEAQEVLKAIQKQKADGKKILENLPSHLVQAIKVGTDMPINADSKEENKNITLSKRRASETGVQQRVVQTNDNGEKFSKKGPNTKKQKLSEFYVSM